MRTSKDIIKSLIKKRHYFTSLSKYICFREFIKLLPPKFQRTIAFVSFKNSQLLIAVKHPAYQVDLNYNKDVIKSILRSFAKHKKECAFLEEVNSLKIIYQRLKRSQSANSDSIPKIPEKSKGSFEIDVKDRDIQKILLEIKEIIKKNVN